MSYTIAAPSTVKRDISFQVSAEDVDAMIDRIVNEKKKNIIIEGYRKGNAPVSIIESRLRDELLAEATEQLIHGQIASLFENEGITPVNRVQLEGRPRKVIRGSEFSFKFQVEVLPDITLPEKLEDLSVKVKEPDIRSTDLDKVVLDMRRKCAELEEVTETRFPQKGDVVLIDIIGEHRGRPVPGMSSKNVYFKVDEEDSVPEINAILKKLHTGETGVGSILCPETHPNPMMRGKNVSLTVCLHAIKTEKLPEFDDVFAAKIGFENLAKLKKSIFESVMSGRLQAIKRAAQQQLLDSLIEKQNYELPPSMVTSAFSAYMKEVATYLKAQSISNEEITACLNDMKKEAEEKVRLQVKAQCFLMALGNREKIDVSEQDADQAIHQMARQSGQQFEQLKKQLWDSGLINDLRERLLANHTLEYLYNKVRKIIVDEQGNPVAMPETGKNLRDALP